MTFRDLYEFKTDSPLMKLVGGVTSEDLTLPVDFTENVKNGGGLDVNTIAVIRGTVANVEQFEAVQITARSVASGPGNLTVIRGWGGTTPQAWSSGTELCCVITAKQMNDICDNLKELSILDAQIAGENLAVYELVYKSSDGKWYKCDTDNYSTVKGFIGIVIKEALANATTTIQMRGVITNPSWSFTIGAAVYPSQYAGTITQDLGAKQLAIGFAVSATSVYFTGLAISELLNALVPVVPVEMGGTGQTTIKDARLAIMPTTTVARRVPMWNTTEGDYVAEDLYVPGVIPFYDADGAYQEITLVEQGTRLAFQKTDGTDANIPVREGDTSMIIELTSMTIELYGRMDPIVAALIFG